MPARPRPSSRSTPQRGGARAGAGRKSRAEEGKDPLTAITLKLEPHVARAWETAKRSHGLSGPALLAKLLNVRADA